MDEREESGGERRRVREREDSEERRRRWTSERLESWGTTCRIFTVSGDAEKYQAAIAILYPSVIIKPPDFLSFAKVFWQLSAFH